MSDNYQAVYDAVRSRFHCGDVGEAVTRALNAAFGNADHTLRCALQDIAAAHTAPSAVYRPTLSLDGDQWCALLGENLQVGVAGFGKSPSEAFTAFDAAFYAKVPSQDAKEGGK